MARPRSTGPTDRELEILQILWERGACTGREITDILNERRKTAHTSVFTMLQIMLDKGLVVRDESQQNHLYDAAQAKEQTQRDIVEEVMKKAFQGSTLNLFASALSAKPTSAEELAEIRKLLDEFEDDA